MKNWNLFAIYDQAAKVYMRPYPAPSTGEAIRDFIDQVNEKGTPLNKHPEDYSLWEVGVFDDQDATITSANPPKCLVKAHEAITNTGE